MNIKENNQKGRSTNPTGCPKGAHNEGRPPNWLREKCREIANKARLVEFLEKVVKGEIKGARVTDRMKATEMILDRGFGRPSQELEVTTHNGDDGRPSTEALIGTIRELREKLSDLRSGAELANKK